MIIEMNKKYHVFLGTSGPCELSVNVGGKIFRAHHDDFNRGLIDPKQLQLLKVAKARIQ
jgi:hypothetical protein